MALSWCLQIQTSLVFSGLVGDALAKAGLWDRRDLSVSEPSQGLVEVEMSTDELGFGSLQARAGAVVQDAHPILQRRPQRRAEPGVVAGMVQARRHSSP